MRRSMHAIARYFEIRLGHILEAAYLCKNKVWFRIITAFEQLTQSWTIEKEKTDTVMYWTRGVTTNSEVKAKDNHDEDGEVKADCLD